jgi:hypothetical protein
MTTDENETKLETYSNCIHLLVSAINDFAEDAGVGEQFSLSSAYSKAHDVVCYLDGCKHDVINEQAIAVFLGMIEQAKATK